MKRNYVTVTVVLLYSVLYGCATEPAQQQGVEIPTGVGEQLLWSSASERPTWAMEEPEASSGVMSFVGLSGNMATERLSRDDARRDAINNVVAYMGTLAKDKFERARVSFGLESSVVDPTTSSREFEKQLAVNIANRVKSKKWYSEKWQTETGIAYRTFLLSEVPVQALDESYRNMATDMARKAEQRANDEADQLAKAQAEKAADFWKQVKEQGLVE